jgi:predicted phage terminase large subunit-like protein
VGNPGAAVFFGDFNGWCQGMTETDTGVLTLEQWARTALPVKQKPAAHHLALMTRLTALADGSITRLMVQMPPGTAKSTYASMLYPAWWLRRHPGTSVIAASHTADLAGHFGRKVRNLVVAHKEVLGYGLAGDSRAAHRFTTTTEGEYFAAGLDGPITGRRADLVLIDDPIKNHTDAESASHRDGVWDWYRTELVTRLKPEGRIALIMTRWHEDDLGGRLLAADEKWEVLRLPALAEEDDTLGRKPGEALWPEYHSAAHWAAARAVVGSRVWSALYQQAPRNDVGTVFPVDRIGYLDTTPSGLRCVRAWDLAATAEGEGRDPDWTVGVKLGREPSSSRVVVLDVARFRTGPGEVAARIKRISEVDGQDVAIGLPQDPGQAGKQQVDWLRGLLAGRKVVSSPETGSKLTRATPVAAQVEAGNLLLLRGSWNELFIEELRAFPAGRKDDQVDALARAFAMPAPPAAAGIRQMHLPIIGR